MKPIYFTLTIFLFLSCFAHAQKRVLYFNDYTIGTDQMTVALNNLGYTITSTDDNGTFQSLISTPGNYDLAIYFAQNYGADYNSVNALKTFVNLPGKKGMYTDWSTDNSAANLVGIQWTHNNNNTQVLVTDSDFAAGLPANPFTVSNTGWGIFTMGMSVNSGGISLAQFTANSQTAIAHTMNRKMIVFGFLGDVIPYAEIFLQSEKKLFQLGAIAACEGSDAFFAIDTTHADSIYWQVNEGSGWSAGFKGGDTLFLNNITTSMNGYEYRYLFFEGADIDTISGGILTVNTAASISQEAKDTSLCEGGNVTLGVLASGTISGYQWQQNNGGGWSNLGSQTNDTLMLNNITASMNGYTYRCIAYSNCGNDTSEVRTLTVYANPNITGISSSLNPSFNSPYQPFKCSNLTATTTGGTGSYTYTWSPSGSGNPLNVCPTAGTWYTATVVDTLGCQDTMSVKQYVIDASYPDPTRVVMCVNVGRRWSSNPVQLSTVPYYLSKGFTLGKCGALPSKQNGFDIDESDADYVVYPNPFNSELNVEFIQFFEENVNIQLTDMTGRVVKDVFNGMLYENELAHFTIDASDLPSGMYLLRYTSNSDLRVNKVQLVR